MPSFHLKTSFVNICIHSTCFMGHFVILFLHQKITIQGIPEHNDAKGQIPHGLAVMTSVAGRNRARLTVQSAARTARSDFVTD